MTPSIEMLNAYFDEMAHNDRLTEQVWFFAGIAAYAHLTSPASEQWKKEHGFTEKGVDDGEQQENMV